MFCKLHLRDYRLAIARSAHLVCWLVSLAAATVVLPGCGLAPPLNRTAPISVAATDVADTRLGRYLQPQFRQHPGKSLCLLLPGSVEAFEIRAITADIADRTLDLQYYIIEDDITTRILFDRVAKAADRGVRVRLLLDDIHTVGIDRQLAVLDVHPNIEVRLFNAFSPPRGSTTGRWLQFLTDGPRLNRRMHNKMWVADNQVAIVGGRNLSDEYFAASDEFNFLDVDMLAAGPVVKAVSSSFDSYWNSEWAVPVRRLVNRSANAADLERLRAQLVGAARDRKGARYVRSMDQTFDQFLHRGGSQPLWATAYAVYDMPVKMEADKVSAGTHIGPQVMPLFDTVRSEVLLISSYFVPGDRGMALFERLRDRKVDVRILTNSLAAIDVVAAQAGYSRYRVPLLELGVTLFEIRPFLGPPADGDETKPKIGTSSSSLHGKAFVFDRKTSFVGSMNIDPRSALFNTELGIVVESEQFSDQVVALFNRATRPRNSFKVSLVNQDAGKPTENGKLVWDTEEEGKAVRYDREPLVSWWRRSTMKVLQMLVPDQIL